MQVTIAAVVVIAVVLVGMLELMVRRLLWLRLRLRLSFVISVTWYVWRVWPLLPLSLFLFWSIMLLQLFLVVVMPPSTAQGAPSPSQ
jgi:hypothetical protein